MKDITQLQPSIPFTTGDMVTPQAMIWAQKLVDAVLELQAIAATGDGTTGGTGSAGAGNQYVELTVNGVTYKVLHDGTV